MEKARKNQRKKQQPQNQYSKRKTLLMKIKSKNKKKNRKIKNPKKKLQRDTKMFLLQCPKCGNRMLYQSKDKILSGKKKACVYCGHSFKVSEHIISAKGPKAK